MTLLAYHNDPKIRAKYLRRVREHAKADEIMQGYGYWTNGKGCAVGCTLHSADHSQYPIELGIPQELAHLEDWFFERLDKKTAKAWPLRFLKAARTGADLSRVYDLWSAWNLDDPTDGMITLVTDAFPEVQRIVRETAQDCRDGKRVNAGKQLEAAGAARAAWAAWAAEAAEAAEAARAAWAAEAARAAWAAEAAGAAGAAWAAWAAEAAWAAGAAGAAKASYCIRASDKLIELMEAA